MSKGFVARCANSSAMAESTFGTGSVQKLTPDRYAGVTSTRANSYRQTDADLDRLMGVPQHPQGSQVYAVTLRRTAVSAVPFHIHGASAL